MAQPSKATEPARISGTQGPLNCARLMPVSPGVKPNQALDYHAMSADGTRSRCVNENLASGNRTLLRRYPGKEFRATFPLALAAPPPPNRPLASSTRCVPRHRAAQWFAFSSSAPGV